MSDTAILLKRLDALAEQLDRIEKLLRGPAAEIAYGSKDAMVRVDLSTLWDNASNQERRWSEEDFRD